LDEPTANLDPLFARKILNLLKKIQVEKKMTVIISEHRMDLILPLVDDIILMKEGEIIAHGVKDEVINSNTFEFQHDIPVSIKDAVSSLKMIK